MTRPGEVQAWFAAFLASQPEPGPCVIWPYAVDKGTGYPTVWRDGRLHRPSRLVLAHFDRPPNPGEDAAHAPKVCHNRLCVNPHHLRWATRAENNADKLLDDTHQRGERHHNAKLTRAQVLDIYRTAEPHHVTAERHGVSPTTVSFIRSGRRWGWLTGAAA